LHHHISVIGYSDENIKRDVIEPQRSKKIRIAKEYECGYMLYALEEDLLSLKEAIFLLDAEIWQKIINYKIDYLELTWHFIRLASWLPLSGNSVELKVGEGAWFVEVCYNEYLDYGWFTNG